MSFLNTAEKNVACEGETKRYMEMKKKKMPWEHVKVH